MGQAVLPGHEDDLGARLEVGVLIIIDGVGNGRVLLLDARLRVHELDGHAVVGLRLAAARERVARARRDAHAGQQGAGRFAVGADDALRAAVDDRDHLHAADGDLIHAVGIAGLIGILLLELDARLGEHLIGIGAVGAVDGDAVAVRDNIAGLGKDGLRKQRADSGGQHRDDDEPPQPRPAARMLCASLHACLLQFLRIFAAAAGFVCGLQLLLLYCNYRAIITFFHDLSSFFLIFLFSSNFLCYYFRFPAD